MNVEDMGNFAATMGIDPKDMDDPTKSWQQKMVEALQKSFNGIQQMHREQQAQITQRQQQLFQRRKGTQKLTDEQLKQWKEIEAAVMANPEFIEGLGLTLAGLMRNKSEVSAIIEEFPDLRFAMANFLRAQAEERRKQNTAQPVG